jgi:UDP-N-acetylglucosamine:LPS N-acetylglucosamine transferase
VGARAGGESQGAGGLADGGAGGEQATAFFFAGGGTGGHIYPGIAIAERIAELSPDSSISFFCSERPIDSHILSASGFDFVKLPAQGFALRPTGLIRFISGLVKSVRIARKTMAQTTGRRVVIASGGFVSVPVALAAARLGADVLLVNVDSVPGKANKLLTRFASRAFIQFNTTKEWFSSRKIDVSVVGCPLRADFNRADGKRAIADLGLDETKKTLVVTGASSGATNINNAICKLLPQLAKFSSGWQIAHVTGKTHYEKIKTTYQDAVANRNETVEAAKHDETAKQDETTKPTSSDAATETVSKDEPTKSTGHDEPTKPASQGETTRTASRDETVNTTDQDEATKSTDRDETAGQGAVIGYRAVDYYERMADLYAAADLIVGRAGAVSVAEYAASATASICIPYPYHRDRHQYLNAAQLADSGAAVIVDDLPGDPEQTSAGLFKALSLLMADDEKRQEMADSASKMANPDSAKTIAEEILATVQ